MKICLPSLLSVMLLGGWISTVSNAQTVTSETHDARAKAAAIYTGT